MATFKDDVDVIERAALPGEEALLFEKPWLVQFADGQIDLYDTEEEACAFQRSWREIHGRDPITGEVAR